jgi:LCP family protein required for cell wall assembly
MLGSFGKVIMWIVRLIALRLIPALLIGGILWSGYHVAGAVARQLDERNSYETQREQFPSTATAIARLMPTVTSTPSPTFTPMPTNTNTATATLTSTPIPPSATPSPTTPPPTSTRIPTDVVTTSTVQADVEVEATTVAVVAQVFVTNTPRPVTFVTNTPIGAPVEPSMTPSDVPTNTSLPTATDEPTATFTLEPTEAATAPPTEVIPPVGGATSELAVLPTPLLPRSVDAGTVINGIEVPMAVPLVQRDYNLENIILLGTDDELRSDGYMLTDTMIIVSINRDTGTVNMLNLPRDLYVYIPTTNGMMQRLNVAYGVGESIGWTGGGFGLLRQTIFYNFGINVHYYAKVDFGGFRDIVDLLGGVNIAVDCAYEDYPLIGAELPDGVRQSTEDGLRVLDVGYYEMSGAQALWYARTRRTSSDFDRGRRQQQLLRAMWHKARQTVNLTNVTDFWTQGLNIVETDMGLDDVIRLMPMMLNLDVSRLESFTFIPTYHTYSLTVDGANVQGINYETVGQLMQDFYRPPSDAQLAQQGATIAVYNGTDNVLWDRVAAERLQWEGFLGYPAGQAPDGIVPQTILIDHTGQQKGSSLNELVRLLNINVDNVLIEPDPSRTSDFTVIVGADYNSCNVSGVLEVGR